MKFEGHIEEINEYYIVRIPKDISTEMPSRGMVMVNLEINDERETVPLEPDGLGSHWLNLAHVSLEAHKGDKIIVSIETAVEWIAPDLPMDLENAIEANYLVNQWDAVTIKAQWEWIRWIRSTKNPQTRKRRIDTACSELEAGKKRPCCFNQSLCTVTDVSKSGVLLE